MTSLTLGIGVSLLSSFVRADDRAPPSPPESVTQSESIRIAAIDKAKRSTIGVFGVDGQGGGSGVVITPDGYALTNYHVTDPFGDRMRCGMSDGEMYEAVIAGVDPTGDLALIKMYGRDVFPSATIADSDTVHAGDWCFASGNPFVLATDLQPSITWGIVSGTHRYQYPSGTVLEYTDCIQTDASINPGNSGGPLYNANGDLIGINGRCSFEKRGRVNVGVGYAISINQAMLFLGHLKSGRIVDHATFGFTVASDDKIGVTVSNILESSDAFRRGIRYEDRVVSFAGEEVRTVNQLKNELGIYPSYSRVPLVYQNADETVETLIRLSPLHSSAELVEIMEGEPAEGKPQLPKKKTPDSEIPEEDLKEKQPEKPNLKATRKSTEVEDPFSRFIEKKTGYANFYFNRREIDRILKNTQPSIPWSTVNKDSSKSPSANAGPSSEKTNWKWNGKVVDESTEYECVVTNGEIKSAIGDDVTNIDLVRKWSGLVESQSMHTISVALRIWQQWHVVGPRAMGETIYIGTTPVRGISEWVDLTQVTTGEVESFVYSSPTDGEIHLIEMQADRLLDRAEVYFSGYQVNSDGIKVPKFIQLRFGNESMLTIELSGIEALAEPKEGA